MSIDIKVPDIGDFKDVPVIEIFVKVGDTVKAEDPLCSLESDKATMDVPAPRGGVVKAIAIKVGDKVSEGSVIMQFAGEGASAAPAEAAKPSVSAPPSPVSAPAGVAEVRVPDIGDFKDVPVIEVFVKVGDTVKAEDPLVSLESDKATMDVPAPLGGVVKEIRVKVGDKVSEGSIIMALSTGSAPAAAAPAASAAAPAAAPGGWTSRRTQHARTAPWGPLAKSSPSRAPGRCCARPVPCAASRLRTRARRDCARGPGWRCRGQCAAASACRAVWRAEIAARGRAARAAPLLDAPAHASPAALQALPPRAS